MGKRRRKAAGKVTGRPVAFDFSDDGKELVTETVRVPDFQPFEITFRVPDRLARLDMALVAAADSSGDAERISRAGLVLRYCARHLVSWTLQPEPNYESMVAMAGANLGVALAIFDVIQSRGEQAKN